MYKVMIVDDEPLGIELIRLSIDWENAGFVVAAACNDSNEALQLGLQIKPDVVITDIRMPETDGLALIAKFKEIYTGPIQFVIMSAYSESAYAQRALRLGVHYFLVKPIMPEEVRDVMQHIKEDLDNILQRNSIENERKEILKRDILRRICKEYPGPSSIENMAEILGDCRDGDYWRYIIIRFKQFLNGRDGFNQESVRPILLLEKTIKQDGSGFQFIEQMENRFDILLNTSASTKAEHNTLECIEQLYNAISTDGTYWFQIVLGKEVHSVLQLGCSWRSAEKAMELTYHIGRNRIIFAEEINGEISPNDYQSFNDIEKIIDAIVLLDEKRCIDVIKQLFTKFYDNNTPISLIRALITNVVYRSLEICDVIHGEHSILIAQIDKCLSVNKDIVEIEELVNSMTNYCTYFIDYMSRLYKSQVKDPIMDVENYITNNYASAITVKSIAEHLNYHTAYIGYLFKKRKGVTVHEYLCQIRINKAMEMIKTTSMSCEEIALATGFNDYSSFFVAFRKYTGLNPTQLKKSLI